MLVHIPHLLTQDQVAAMQSRLDAAPWADGRLTAGHQSAQAKSNLQLPQEDAAARELGEEVLRAWRRARASSAQRSLAACIHPCSIATTPR